MPKGAHVTRESAPLRRPASVAVGADDLALLDLHEDLAPRLLTESSADHELLVPDVVELEDQDVALAAVGALPLLR